LDSSPGLESKHHAKQIAHAPESALRSPNAEPEVVPSASDALQVRKATLASVLAKVGAGIRFNEHMEFDDGEAVFRHACRMGLEGIVSKRKDSTYRSGLSPHWVKSKNPDAPAVRREAEEDWGK
jgi:bifunctional non-homologous end joining protein LigD